VRSKNITQLHEVLRKVSMASVGLSPIRATCLLARVTATFMRRRLLQKPTLRHWLLRTMLMITTPFSAPTTYIWDILLVKGFPGQLGRNVAPLATWGVRGGDRD